MKKIILVILCIAVVGFGAAMYFWSRQESVTKSDSVAVPSPYAGKKILLVNSYHQDYQWSDRAQAGALAVLDGTGVETKVMYMDTKNNPGNEFGQAAAAKVLAEIAVFKPDVLIVQDDAAFKYVVAPHFRDAALPVVFSAVNYDLKAYDGPYKNTTGMIETSPYRGMIEMARPFAKGNRVAFITGDNISERKNAEMLTAQLPDGMKLENVFETEAGQWKKDFLALQERADIIVVGVGAGIMNWDDKDIRGFLLVNTKVPTTTELEWMSDMTVFSFGKVPGEQGEYAAQAALQILDGKSISEIPIITNTRGSLFINKKLTNKLGIQVPAELLSKAVVLE